VSSTGRGEERTATLRVIAHRGASGTAPENTLAAFQRAEALGAHMIELDVQLSRDAEVVVFHDTRLERTTNGRGAVGERTLAALRRLDAGAWFAPRFVGERVPTLVEVLRAVALPVNVELKPGIHDLEERVLAAVHAAQALGRVLFSSFDPCALERLRARAPEASLAVLWQTQPISDALRLAKRVVARALHLRKDAATAETLASAVAAGLTVSVWTVNDPAEIRRLAAGGVTGVFTDYPERFLHHGPLE
jgi:glycerophosphoryl diester phosphodiesterase